MAQNVLAGGVVVDGAGSCLLPGALDEYGRSLELGHTIAGATYSLEADEELNTGMHDNDVEMQRPGTLAASRVAGCGFDIPEPIGAGQREGVVLVFKGMR